MVDQMLPVLALMVLGGVVASSLMAVFSPEDLNDRFLDLWTWVVVPTGLVAALLAGLVLIDA